MSTIENPYQQTPYEQLGVDMNISVDDVLKGKKKSPIQAWDVLRSPQKRIEIDIFLCPLIAQNLEGLEALTARPVQIEDVPVESPRMVFGKDFFLNAIKKRLDKSLSNMSTRDVNPRLSDLYDEENIAIQVKFDL